MNKKFSDNLKDNVKAYTKEAEKLSQDDLMDVCGGVGRKYTVKTITDMDFKNGQVSFDIDLGGKDF